MAEWPDGLVDAHQHFWDPARGAYPWMVGPFAPLARPYLPADLEPALRSAGVAATVAVQARADEAETRDLLALAVQHPFIAGVVGWVDLTRPDVPAALAALRAAPGGERLVGIRHQVHDEADPNWLGRHDVRRGLRAVQDAGLVYDLLVRPRELPAALALARALPDLPLVVDHLAKPPVRTGALEPWAERLAPLAALEQVACKLSGLVTEAEWGRWTTADLLPYIERALGWFGAERLLFGSDWPVCLLAAPSYAAVLDAARRALEAALGSPSAAVTRQVFGENARRVYRLAGAATPARA